MLIMSSNHQLNMLKWTLALLFWINVRPSSTSLPQPPQPKLPIFTNNGNGSILPKLPSMPTSTISVGMPYRKKGTSGLLTKLRALFVNLEFVKQPLSGYLIMSRDTHYLEFLPPCDELRAFITGFDGSAGDALLTTTKALLWTDGRYHHQALAQMDDSWTLMKVGIPGTPTMGEWINREMGRGAVIGVDPKLITIDEWNRLHKELTNGGNKLVAVDVNLVDLIWEGRPKPSSSPVAELPLEFTGKSTADKLVDVRKELEKQSAHYLVVSELDEIAWLLNWRGADSPYSPVFFSYLIVGRESLQIFIEPEKVSDEILESLSKQEQNATLQDYQDIFPALEKLVKETKELNEKIWVSKYCSYHLANVVPYARRITKVTPIAYMKAIKNPVEVQGMKNCHIRDAVAVCQLFGWLEKLLNSGETVTEVVVAKKVNEFRSKLPNFMGLSFPTIAGSGPYSALIHYFSESAPLSRLLSLQEVLLLDSGGQYLDGTTDVSRTVHFGTPTPFQKECYTRVLKGQIQIVNTTFPNKLTGNYLDAFARQALWNVGLDYAHGTSHGIGSALNVHEGPSGISWKPFPDDMGLEENMFMSNEPGYYHENEFGIRLENIVRVVKANPKYNFGTRGFLTFEDITMVPIQHKMMDLSLLSTAEIQYINSFHKECRQKVGDYMKSIGIPETDPGYIWLLKETQAIHVAPKRCNKSDNGDSRSVH